MRRLTRGTIREARNILTLMRPQASGALGSASIPQPTTQNEILIANAALVWSLLDAPTEEGQVLVTGADPYTPVWTALTVEAISDLAYTVPALTLSTANAEGAADTVIRSDATILVFDATAPNIIQPDDAAAVGSATVAARRDHEHGIVCAAPADPSVSLAASTEGSGTSFARADHAHQLDQSITPTWAALHTFDAGITFGGATGVNVITVPDNLAQATHLVDAGGIEYWRVVSTDAQTAFVFNEGGADIDHRWEAVGQPNALFVQGSTGYIALRHNNPAWMLDIRSEETGADGAVVALYEYHDDYHAHYLLRRSRNTMASPADVQVGDVLGEVVWQGYRDGAFSDACGIVGFAEALGTSTVRGALAFYTRNDADDVHVERIRIDRNGYLGILTPDPMGPLHVFVEDDNPNIWDGLIIGDYDGATEGKGGFFAVWDKDDNVAKINVFATTTGYGIVALVNFGGLVAIGQSSATYKLDVFTDHASGFAAKFFNDGDDVNRYGIAIYYGKDDQSATTNYPILCYDGDGDPEGGLVCTNGTMSVYNPSDASLKTGIESLEGGLRKIMALRPVEFNWKQAPDGPRVRGFIGQEVREVLPGATCELPEGSLATIPGKMIPLLVGAIQEQQRQIEELCQATKRGMRNE